jgi:pre-mRNA-processing factor 40
MDSIGKESENERHLWSKYYSANGKAYYYNLKTGKSQWEKPDCMMDEDSDVE